MSRRVWCSVALAAVTVFLVAVSAFGHISIWPLESTTGAYEKYTMRVPTSFSTPSARKTPTVRIELEFPPKVTVESFELKPGWKVEHKKDAKGKIIGAVWSGGAIGDREFVEFDFIVHNPAEETTLTWKAIQIFQDGQRAEWTGPPGARRPAAVTTVKKAAPHTRD